MRKNSLNGDESKDLDLNREENKDMAEPDI